MNWLITICPNTKNTITNSTILIHYTGVTKPWHTWGINYPASQFFQFIYSLTVERSAIKNGRKENGAARKIQASIFTT